jgi:hypothetical protein
MFQHVSRHLEIDYPIFERSNLNITALRRHTNLLLQQLHHGGVDQWCGGSMLLETGERSLALL